MSRLRRRTIATRRVSVRYTETHTRTLCKRSLEEMMVSDMTKMFLEKGITLTPEISNNGDSKSPRRARYGMTYEPNRCTTSTT